MVKYLAGLKGEGKTRMIIDLANESAKTTDGNLVFIDDDKRHIFELHRDIRFVETGKGVLDKYREFIGFVLGILSQNSDIRHIFVDGLTNIVTEVDNEVLIKLHPRLEAISNDHHVDFTICMNYDKALLPEVVKTNLLNP